MARSRQSVEADPAQAAAIAALPTPAVITHDHWNTGGTEIIYANPAFCRLTGYSEKELAGKNTRLLHGAKTDLPLLQQACEDGEGWLHRRDGAPFFARWKFAPLSPGRLVAVYHDRSDGHQLHAALLQSQKLATLGLLAGGVAHDFNNLITVINGYCEIVRGKSAGATKVQRDLDEIHRAGLKASTIARQILEFSRRQKAEVCVVNYNTLIREIAEILRRVAGDTVKVELRLASDLGNVRIDPTQFQQVLLNLCFNARDAMPDGGRLTIRTRNHQAAPARGRRPSTMNPGFYAVMQVSDTGLGMTAAVLGSIFEPFFTTKPHGTGLGLATVQSIIHQHNGHIAAQSTPGAGSTFEIFLPETAEPEQTAPLALGRLPSTAGTEPLLIIEADLVLRKMIAGILSNDGYRVTELATAAEAEAALAEGGVRPELVLAHGDDPAVVALLRRLRTGNRSLRLISVSAQAPAAGLAKVPARSVLHLPKPFALSTLMLSVRTLLDVGRS